MGSKMSSLLSKTKILLFKLNIPSAVVWQRMACKNFPQLSY